MAQRSEDGVGKTSEMSRRLERALAVWTRSAISIQASSRDDGCINRPDTRKHLNLREQISRKPPCIQRGVHTRTLALVLRSPGTGRAIVDSNSFKAAWTRSGDQLYTHPLDALSASALPVGVKNFLHVVGLPDEAAPF
jgi:hypothetical protein